MKRIFLRLDLNRLHNEEWFNFFIEYKGFVLFVTAAVLGIDTLFTKFLQLLQKVEEALEQIRKSPITDDLAMLDHRRDNAFRMLKTALKFGMSSPDAEQKNAAKKLESVFKHYGNLALKSYDDETAGIINFIQDLRGEYAPYVQILNWTPMINDLEFANNAFETAMMQRTAQSANRPDFKMAGLRRDINRCYLDMLENMEAQVLLHGGDDIEEFAKTLNANIERYKNTLARRKPVNKDTETKDEEDSTI